MTLSLETVAAARIALAEKALVSKDPRYLAAYHELGREWRRGESTAEIIAESRIPMLTKLQAGGA